MSSAPFGLAAPTGAPPGTLISYAEFTANVAISATTEVTANTVVTAPAFIADGSSAFLIEFFTPQVTISGATDQIVVTLYDNAATQGFFGVCTFGAVATLLRRRLIPTAGSHAYSIRAYRGTSNGTINAGVGGAAAYLPGYVMITKAS